MISRNWGKRAGRRGICPASRYFGGVRRFGSSGLTAGQGRSLTALGRERRSQHAFQLAVKGLGINVLLLVFLGFGTAHPLVKGLALHGGVGGNV